MYTTINYNVTFFLLFFFTLIFLHLISFKLTNFINHVPISPMKRVNDTFSNLWHTVTWCRVAGGGSSRINPSLNTNPLFEHVVHCVQYTRTYISNNMTLKADCFFFFILQEIVHYPFDTPNKWVYFQREGAIYLNCFLYVFFFFLQTFFYPHLIKHGISVGIAWSIMRLTEKNDS